VSSTGSVTVHVEANERIQVGRSSHPAIDGDGERALLHVNIGGAGHLCVADAG
jgi:hypothetical protein